MAGERRPDLPGIPSRHLKPKEPMHSLRPSPESVRVTWETAKRWSPAGITAAFLIFFFAIGGHAGVAKLSEAITGANALKGEIKGLRADLALERQERAKVMARLYATELNVAMLCDFVSAQNEGKPNESWCSNDGRAIAVRFKHSPPPVLITDAAWKHVEMK